MEEFTFSDEQRRTLFAIMKRGNDSDRVQYFIDQTERAIGEWCRWWPNTRIPGRYKQIQANAWRLHRDLEELKAHPHALTQQMEGYGENLALVERSLVSLAGAAGELHATLTESLPEKVANQDLCNALAREYCRAFRALPSWNSAGQFSNYCARLAYFVASPVPVRISRDMVKAARGHNRQWLEDLTESGEPRY